MRKRNNVQKNGILLVGASQGGAVSALTASRHPRHIGALALMYPAFSITADAQARYSSYSQVPNRPDIFGITVGKAYYRGLFDMDLTHDATKFNGPVLIVHGQADDTVPIRYSRQAQHNFRNATLKEIPNARHGFSGADLNRSIKYMDDFVDNLKS
ncbi:alpha beta superfamily hydrolase [Lactobacillus kalixensis DSM 16043]|uniref:Alpha beta superfamily hydrolase n=1 Tax=Lactobacillus kalixensis DSM 16043 TaxID=1423763 RepID=A0A0R1UJA9_9LACO|nr:alpha beta superfamily hydrolase [Lactobacillus kalixensis DSM 16043]